MECAYCARDSVNRLLAQTNHGKRKYWTVQLSSQIITWFECQLKLGFTAASVRKRNRPAPRSACFIRFGREMRTRFSELLFWSVVFVIIAWVLKLLALKIWNNKLEAVVRGQISGERSFSTSSNEPQENDEQNLRKEPEENDERESWKEPQENDERF